MKLTRILLALMLMFSLAACGSDGDKEKKDEAEEKPVKVKEVTPICPQVAIMRDIDVLQDYGAEKPNPSELVAQAKMTKVTGDCEYKDKGIDIQFELNFIAAKGPRLGGLHTNFPYFIAVVDPEQNILNKERMTVEIGFASDEKMQTHAETLHVFIPLAKENRASGPSYRVLAGFQLTQEQMDVVKQKRDATQSDR